ncbi:methyltransferase [Burkholderia thailandensis]|uniref:O-methyltransferase family protein n=1 Tax=Burkholderia thailandensis TaxID=57975 RepID=A0AAW9D2J9_BURTH|nr:methyltransferase [Burkholderia thailandensis]MCS3390321.1 methyltransferase [Burkholderia thailandensis]MCS6425737.1 methyltransferase [Burkholderia thailandensis]MCS6454153.1 methyltransferase [Burkholderia thailandensis]MCS6462391.1 methyltransferase [Burkholderia thailandensis]MCS6483339.1 methyltransferase [Burkholderia thailandensis]
MTRALPRYDDAAAFDVAANLFVYPAMLIAHRLGLFDRLGERARSLGEIGAALGLARRPAEALVNATVALGFVRRDGDRFALTARAQDLLLPASRQYFGAFWDLMYDNGDTFSIAGLEAALRRDAPRAYGETDIFDSHQQHAELGMRFMRAMESLSASHAMVWPTKLDLARHRVMLDVGGGSGASAVGALSAWPSLHAVLFDLPAVCELGATFVDARWRERVTLHPGNMWRDPFPAADLHFYSNIFHDWPADRNAALARKSFDALPRGGRIVVHEVLYRDDKGGPLAAAGYSLMMIGWTQGEQYTSHEVSAMLADAGFASIETIPSFGYSSLVTGVKP